MSVNPDILVIGGGVIGSATARALAIAGHRVTVVDPGGAAGQGWQAAAGLLTPQIEGREEDPLFDFGVAGRAWYVDHHEELVSGTGMTFDLMLGGVIRLALDDAEAEQLREVVAWQRQHGHYAEWLDPDEVREQWPSLGECRGALLAPRDGALDPARLVQALIIEGNRLGVRRVEDRVTGLINQRGRIAGAQGRETWTADVTILAAGAWSGRLTGLPRPVSVEPIRGQMLAMPRPRSLDDLIVFGRGHYVLTRGEEVVAGSTMEHVGFTLGVTDEGLDEIRTAVATLCPTLATAEASRTWSGLRPVTPDGLPIIGREPRVEGLWYATGHGRQGVLLAGITGVVLAQMIAGEATLEHVQAFRPERFWSR